jgi:hypothetical protein
MGFHVEARDKALVQGMSFSPTVTPVPKTGRTSIGMDPLFIGVSIHGLIVVHPG